MSTLVRTHSTRSCWQPTQRRTSSHHRAKHCHPQRQTLTMTVALMMMMMMVLRPPHRHLQHQQAGCGCADAPLALLQTHHHREQAWDQRRCQCQRAGTRGGKASLAAVDAWCWCPGWTQPEQQLQRQWWQRRQHGDCCGGEMRGDHLLLLLAVKTPPPLLWRCRQQGVLPRGRTAARAPLSRASRVMSFLDASRRFFCGFHQIH